MCGIAGRWPREEPATPLEVALERLAHRGPDDRGTWKHAGSRLELGHTRLSIIDLSAAGRQPMASEDGRHVLTYNGELYNHRALRSELLARGHRFRGSSDTEVVLAMFVEHGRAMFERLNGMFALAVFDTERRELTLARDASGIKPLYLCDSPHGFAFASELKALLPLLPVARTLDMQAICRYLAFLSSPGTATPLAAVQRLAPGHLAVVRDGRLVDTSRWARLPFVGTGPERAPDGEAAREAARDTPREVADALRTAVHRQLLADVPVGAFLSGGLDSSAVVAFARERSPQLDCFTIAPDGGPDAGDGRDLPFARRVARHLGVPLHEVPIDSARMAGDLESMVYALDEPIADPASLNVLYISRLARQHGVKVLLSGVGGDDLFAGYRRHRALGAERLWSWLPAPARAGLRRGSALGARSLAHEAMAGVPVAARVLARRAARAFAHADADADGRLLGYFAWAEPGCIAGLLAPEHRASATRLYQPLSDYLEELGPGLAPLDRMLALEQRFFLGDHNLPYADKMSMAAGVEVRVPFLDPDLIALANRLPASLKQRGRHGKWILKRALEPHLPHDVIYRPKAGFGAPLRRWLRGGLADLLGDVLSPQRLRERGLFDAPAVLALLERDRRGEIDAAYPILGLACVELWCRRFVDGKLPGSGAPT